MRSVLRAAGARVAPGGSDDAPWRSVARSAGAKLLVLGVSGLVSIVSIRLVLGHYGVEAYAQYGLLVSIAALLPFADLGMGAAVLNSVAGSADPARDEHVRRTLVGVFRVIALSGSLLVAVGVVVTVAGGWPALLGDGLRPGSGPAAALTCLVLFCLTLPLAVGQRILTALGRNHVRVLVQGLASPLFATTVGVLVLTGARAGGYLAAFSYAGGALTAALGSVLAFRSLPGLAGRVLHDVWRVRSVRGAPVLGVAGPWLVLTLALPVAMQTDRLLLSHLSTPTELAEYGLGFSLFSLLSQTVTAAGVALWPVFARARSAGRVRSPARMAVAFGAGAALAALVLVLLLPWVVPVVSGGAVRLDGWLTGAFAALVVVQAANYPLGMYMTDAAGLRFQILPVLVMVPLNLGLSWWLTLHVGAGGPVAGSAVAVALCQFAPGVFFVRRDLRRRAAAGVSAA
ncbi:lipopolysaccharide biosynthesis protein [Kineococcus sp. TBRC 1896]|uniref:Lipopolysaccharide biosynthesis protein n=1 Tax=Kineococcus mangrovi TaxID=1660183 RepID=A0ABV4HW74_9ACTN